MAVYESHYKEMRFIVDGVPYKFRNGKYATEDEKVQAALDTMQFVSKQEDAKPEEPEKPKKQTAKKKKAE